MKAKRCLLDKENFPNDFELIGTSAVRAARRTRLNVYEKHGRSGANGWSKYGKPIYLSIGKVLRISWI